MRARGMAGLLERTKTSGADKKIAALPLYVSKEAYIAHEWLLPGLALWTSPPFFYKRDYLLCLPSADLAGTCGKRAKYCDAQGFSRSLLAGLLVDSEDPFAPLLLPSAVDFWSEHSDRAGLDSWLASLSVGADLRKFVGRWSAGGSEDIYIRTAARIVENCQRLAAIHARATFAGGADYFCEEEVLEQCHLT